jgi:cell division protein FtsW
MLSRLLNIDKIKPQGDPIMWIIIVLLSVWGLVAVYSSTGALAYAKHGGSAEVYLFQQFAYLAIGFYVMLFIHSIHYKMFMRVAKLVLYISYVLLVLTLFVGAEINDAQRWLKIPFIGITFQTSEVVPILSLFKVSTPGIIIGAPTQGELTSTHCISCILCSIPNDIKWRLLSLR